jgi:hypothetical protein
LDSLKDTETLKEAGVNRIMKLKYLKKQGGGMDLIRMIPKKNQWQTSENTKTELQFSYSGGIYCVSEDISLRSRNLQHESLTIKLFCCLLRLIYFVFIMFDHFNFEINIFFLFSQAF